MHWVKRRIPLRFLLGALFVAFSGLLLLKVTVAKTEHPYYEKQLEAAALMKDAIAVISNAKKNLGLPIDKEIDPNETGLLGDRFTMITTSLGNLEAKRTSTNPSFAALMVKYFVELNLGSGDVVAIGASGSFPGLTTAVLAASHVLELQPLLFYSVGSSMYGANIPEFTFPEMLSVLNKEGLLSYKILAVSLGGDNDQGDGMYFAESQAIMKKIAESTGAYFISEGSNAASIRKRLKLYKEYNYGNLPDCFVNVGGASPNYGNTGVSTSFPNGLSTSTSFDINDPERGLLFEFLERGVPVIHLLNIRDLAIREGLAVDPIPFPTIGTEDIYFKTETRNWFAWLTIIGIFAVLATARFIGPSGN